MNRNVIPQAVQSGCGIRAAICQTLPSLAAICVFYSNFSEPVKFKSNRVASHADGHKDRPYPGIFTRSDLRLSAEVRVKLYTLIPQALTDKAHTQIWTRLR